MEKNLSDGTISWIGGMDTSRDPANLGEIQYSKACNVVIPESLGGLKARFGLHCANLIFDNKKTKIIYQTGNVQGEGYFSNNGRLYLICVTSGYVLKFTRRSSSEFYVENLNAAKQNNSIMDKAWVITIPGGCIVNNGFDYPLHVTEDGARRTKPIKGEIGIGQMGVYLQNRLFYVDQSGKKIIASDFLQPTKFTREDTNIEGFMCPDSNEKIVAIGRQKSILGTVEGGNLIWSSNKDIYSVDVRGTRSEWGSLGSKVGKTTETIPGFSASSSYSFEPFNTNIYFRSKQFGICDIRQSEYQFTNVDTTSNQSQEASHYLNNDTDWMLDKCYTRACNKRLFTTVAPEKNENGFVYWNGILSHCPSTIFINQGTIPRQFESVFTGVRPWCLTAVTEEKDELFIHSFDVDGVTRLYVMNEDSDYDINPQGDVVEIQGFVETRAYTFQNPMMFKRAERRFYKLNLLERSTKIKLFSRGESHGEWSEMWDESHLVCRANIINGVFVPAPHKGQTRSIVNVSGEKFPGCYKSGNSFLSIQYRIEFTGPVNIDAFVITAIAIDGEKTTHKSEKECETLIYEYRPDYGYSIANHL